MDVTNLEENQIDSRIAESPEILGRTCAGCARDLAFAMYRRDSSYRDGHRPLCLSCESSPRLSIDEHTHRLREQNWNDERVSRQRWEDQDLYYGSDSKRGRYLHSSELIHRLRKLIPSLFITEGRIEGDLSLYRIFPCKQPHLNNNDFQYLGFCPTGMIQEWSEYEFDGRDVLVREKWDKRGWRTVLMKLIKSGLLSEDDCNKEFGYASGEASGVWQKQLWKYRNRK